jgi:hypothetical protein
MGRAQLARRLALIFIALVAQPAQSLGPALGTGTASLETEFRRLKFSALLDVDDSVGCWIASDAGERHTIWGRRTGASKRSASADLKWRLCAHVLVSQSHWLASRKRTLGRRGPSVITDGERQRRLPFSHAGSHDANSWSSALASFRSSVSKPSMNQP